MTYTLWNINTRLAELMQARRELLDETIFIEDGPISLAEIDKAIREYVAGEIANNPETVHTFILESRARQDDLKKEMLRLEGLLAAEEGEEARAKEIVLEVMRELDVKKLGVRGKLARQGNGGVQPVEIGQPELIPDEFRRYSLELTGPMYAYIRDLCRGDLKAGIALKSAVSEPDRAAIRERLLHCSGASGGVPGATLLPRGEHLVCK